MPTRVCQKREGAGSLTGVSGSGYFFFSTGHITRPKATMPNAIHWDVVMPQRKPRGSSRVTTTREAAPRPIRRPEEPPLDQAHRREDQVTEDHRRAMSPDDVRIRREE